MKSVFAVTDTCAGCGACIKTCPEKAIRPAPKDHDAPLIVLEDRCSGCAECAEVCPVSACVEVPLDLSPTPHSLLPTPFQRTSLSLHQDPA